MKQQEMASREKHANDITATSDGVSAPAADESAIDWVDRIVRTSYRSALRRRFATPASDSLSRGAD
jgi:hypothetical protein